VEKSKMTGDESMVKNEMDSDLRLRELMLYIASRCQDDAYFGRTKLNKALYWADVLHYAETGRSITGAEYQRLQWGPAPRRVIPNLLELESTNRGVETERSTAKGTQKRLVPLKNPNLSLFNGEEIARIDWVLNQLTGQTSNQLSNRTHDDAIWKCAQDGETLNFNAIFISLDPLTAEEIELGQKEAIEQGIA
jgi:hypothetical protein